MEMESSRRPSFDRSRELGLKRPRLAEEPNLNNRPFQQKQQRPANSGSTVSAASARFRANSDRDRESDESVRGSYQQPSQLQQHQELISQYKAALAELTFNSKPIITNLTIIAGENTHAAKAIAGTICANIIEVPSDQKLPSLYLLDSIVKNIGRDYIKYFAAKLPEVFCKAYRQVDSPVHASMQHLFGTWKGVFPPQPLQIIERELGFLAAANGSSSSSTITRADSQTQRQPHSIHVNPKYLEARRLQQSGRNVPQPQREELRDTVHEKPLGAESEDHEYGSGLSRHITSRLGKSSERMADHSYDKQWSSAGRGVEESMSSQKNGVNARQSTPSLMASRSANVHLLPTHNNAVSRSSRDLPRSWKNSEEEEFMWDDLNPGVADHIAVDNIQKDHWTIDGLDKSEFGGRNTNRLNQAVTGSRIDREIDSLSSEQVPFARQRSSWQSQEQLLVQGSDIPLPRTAFQSHVGSAHATGASSFGLSTIAASGSAGSLGQRHGSSGKPLISQPSSRDPRLNVSEKEQAQANSLPPPNRKPALPLRSSDGPHNPKLHDSFAGVHQSLNLDINRKSEPQTLQKMTSAVSSFRAKQYNPPAQQLPLGQAEAEPSSGFQSRLKQLVPSGTLNHVPGESAGQMNASALLAAILKSGVPPVPLTDGTQPSSSSGSSHTSLAGPRVRSSSDSPHDLLSLLSQIKTDEPPQSSGPSPTSSLSRTANSDGTSSSSNPFSSLLNTLVAKGLITASKTESAPPPKIESATPLKTEAALPALKSKSAPPASLLSSKSNNQSPSIAITTSAEVPSVSSNTPSSTANKTASSKASHAAPEMSKSEIVNLIGFEFKPDILRQFHSSVVDGLFEDLPHCCNICGLRLKLKERLDRHLEWHALKQSEVDKSSGMWYSNSDYWVAGKAAVDSGSNIVEFSQESGTASEEDPEPMVPADESHCVCLLCGELFEDYYSLKRDEWMFKGAVYMTVSSESGARASSSKTPGQGVIVHAKCMADESVRDLDLANIVKLEKDV